MFSDEDFFHYSLLSLYLITPPTIFSLLFLTAPYGKHHRPGWGPTISPPLAWCLMESPTIWLTLLLFPHGRNSTNPRAAVLISPFLLHYLHRSFIYPLRLFLRTPTNRIKKPGFPVSIALLAFGFNLLNAYLQGRWVSEYADLDGDGWFWWRMAAGAVVFGGGAVANVWSDSVLMGLKDGGGGGYKIPKGGLFEFVSCPNYFGEIMEWLGWALMTWSWAGLGFFMYTCANLVPRAVANHNWYLEKFGEDYPKTRKSVIPFLY
ncbi:hypothetical protein ABFX02_10G022900 [Erythranthe guttata]